MNNLFGFILLIVGTSLAGEGSIQNQNLLWNPALPMPEISAIPCLENVTFHVIKKYQPAIDTYNWLHGVALAWHKEKLYASYGLNTGRENTATEVAAGSISNDGGKSWSELFIIDAGDEQDLAVSHGVFLSTGDALWAFQGCFYGRREKVHMRAYVLDEEQGRWEKKGVVAEQGFWPMCQPVELKNGNYIISGFSAEGKNQSAVAISDGENLLKWTVVLIPQHPEIGRTWGESTVLVEGRNIINISRYGSKSVALISHSRDFGYSWTLQTESNLVMTTSKPYGGTLPGGESYLFNSIAADIGSKRYPLMIAVGKAGLFSNLFQIRTDWPLGEGAEGKQGASFSYPYVVAHAGNLYVGYSNDEGRGKNRNRAELAIIPLNAIINHRE